MPLDFTSLRKAIASLDSALRVATLDDEARTRSAAERDVIRAGVIQNFEFTYELCWKFIQRWIREYRTPEEVDSTRTRNDLFRIAARYHLVRDPAAWFDYGEARNLSSHAYDAQKAATIFAAAAQFLPEAQYLLAQLEQICD
jgi:nucleotidyltransferase substrate binding protein (TIGR01987 family)